MIRLGIVGVGGYARTLLRLTRQRVGQGRCRLVAAVVRRPQRVADQLPDLQAEGVHICRSMEQMIDAHRDAIDAAIIPTGIATHAPLTIAALGAGWHVLVEKPPAATVQDVDAMLAAQQAAGKVCMVGFQQLSGSVNHWLKSRIVAGRLGRILEARCRARWVRRDSYYERNAWAGRLRDGVGWILDGTINNPFAHQIANMLFLASAEPYALAVPTRVRGELYAGHDIEGEDTASAVIETAEGAKVTFAATLCCAEPVNPEITVIGEAGRAVWNRDADGAAQIHYQDGSTERMEPAGRANDRMFDGFLDAVEGEAPVNSSLQMCRNFTLAVNGAFESAVRTRRIDDAYLTRTPDRDSVATVIDGIDELVDQAAERGATFSDLGAPWAVPTEPFDLTDYREFPQQFGAELPDELPTT
jgi:predicted dehydrogenase